MISKVNNFDFLLEKDSAKKFLNENSIRIFGDTLNISIVDIKRSSTYSSTSCNILYKIVVNNVEKKIRVSGSTIFKKKRDFDVLKYFYTHGFDSGDFLVSRPLALLEEENIFFYEDIDGQTFKQSINSDFESLKNKVKLSAQLLKKIHSLPKPDFELWYTHLVFNFEQKTTNNLVDFYEEFTDQLPDIILRVKEDLLNKQTPVFCHGDYQPDNLIFGENKTYVLDFSLASLADKEYDLAHFITQLGVMLNMYGNIDFYEKLKQIFLTYYGDFDERKLALYSILADYRVLEVYRQVNEKRYLQFVLGLFRENLKKADLI